ncbi:hypothetical protein C0J52_04456 [Blattella germanica]|nr:hypothetical protein C0J52_04456 [Blattella germanica]
MTRTSKILLLVVVLVSFITIAQCNLYGEQIRQFFKNIYAAPYEERSVNRRNIPTLTGNGVFQEPSSRDLDVGFAVGVKDEGEAKDILINNHSSKTYSPTDYSQSSNPSSYAVEPETASKQVNIGLYLDPKNGVRYFTPNLAPGGTTQNYFETFPAKPIATQTYPGPAPIYPTFVANQPIPASIPYQPPFTPYPLISPAQNYGQRYLNLPPINQPSYPYQVTPSFSPIPAPQQNYPISRIINPDRFQNIPYPYQNDYYQEPLETDPYFGRPYPSNPFSDPISNYRQQAPANVLDEGLFQNVYAGRFRRNHGRFPYQNSPFRYRNPMRNFQNVFEIEDQAPRGSYGQFTQPVIVRQEPQVPEIIVDQRGRPMMTSEPYGERQVGAFKLKNDHGYQVTMNVPPIPADGPADGVLVMEMKANLYRPLS